MTEGHPAILPPALGEHPPTENYTTKRKALGDESADASYIDVLSLGAPDPDFVEALTDCELSVMPMMSSRPDDVTSMLELLCRRQVRLVWPCIPRHEDGLLWRSIARVLRAAQASHTAWVIETPWPGPAWEQPVIRDMLGVGNVVALDQCAFGSRARCRTGLVSLGVDLTHLACECAGGRQCRFHRGHAEALHWALP